MPWDFRRVSQNPNFMYDKYKKDMTQEIKMSNLIINHLKYNIIQYL